MGGVVLGTRETIYLGSNPQDLPTKVRHGYRDRCIRLCTKSVPIIEIPGQLAPSSILQLKDNTTRVKL